MNLMAGQAFQAAGSPAFPVQRTNKWQLEIRRNPQAGMPALRVVVDGFGTQDRRKSREGSSRSSLFS
jgi:hypothetical protein